MQWNATRHSAITATMASVLISSSSQRSVADELARLADLRDRDRLSDDEYSAAKAMVLTSESDSDGKAT